MAHSVTIFHVLLCYLVIEIKITTTCANFSIRLSTDVFYYLILDVYNTVFGGSSQYTVITHSQIRSFPLRIIFLFGWTKPYYSEIQPGTGLTKTTDRLDWLPIFNTAAS